MIAKRQPHRIQDRRLHSFLSFSFSLPHSPSDQDYINILSEIESFPIHQTSVCFADYISPHNLQQSRPTLKQPTTMPDGMTMRCTHRIIG